MKRVLVTGGSGFIGSHVVDALLAAGISPRIFDLRPSPHHDPAEAEYVAGDLLDGAALRKAMRGCDAVIHMAAAADVSEVAENPVGSEQANSHGTVSVLDAARSAGVERVVYSSTIWVYGDAPNGEVTEDSALHLPRHLYTASKLAGEMYCTSYAELYGLSYTIVRLGIPYGPRARAAAVVPSFVEKALAGEPLTIAGDGSQSRRFVYVEDLADGIVRALRPAAANQIYNLVGEQSVTIRELADAIRSELGAVEIVHTPGRAGDFSGAEISGRRAANELGWKATTPLQEGVSRYVDWRRGVAAEASAASRETKRRPQQAPVLGTASIVLAAVVAPLLSYLLAAQFDRFDDAQLNTIWLTAMAAILAGVAIQLGRGRSLVLGSLVFVAYLTLLIVPWTRHTLELAPPHLAALLFSTVGAGLALAAIAGSRRLRAGGRAEPEHAV